MTVPLLDVLAFTALLTLALILVAIQPTAPVQLAGLLIAALSPLARHDSRRLSAGLLLAGVLGVALGGPGEVDCSEMLPAIALLTFAVGADPCRRDTVRLGLVAFVILVVEMLQDPIMGPGAIVVFTPIALVAWLSGRGAGALREKAAELERRHATLVRQRADTARLAVELERDRVGIELGDAISAGLREMLAATADARSGVRCLPDALAAVEDRGRLLLDDMRGVLGILRRHTDGPDRAPQPSLQDLDRLLAEARGRGVTVSLRREGDERPVADAPDRSAYRIIERALEWASPEPVEICLRWRERELELDIESGVEPGFSGLHAAARERAAVCGGRVATLRPATGRAGLRAHLPLAGVRA